MAHRDPVTPKVREAVFRRDRGCIAARVDSRHLCRDQWGNAHSPYDLSRMTLEHVKEQPRMGVRAPSDEAHLLTLCARANIDVPSAALRGLMRGYLSELYPDAWAEWWERRG